MSRLLKKTKCLRQKVERAQHRNRVPSSSPIGRVTLRARRGALRPLRSPPCHSRLKIGKKLLNLHFCISDQVSLSATFKIFTLVNWRRESSFIASLFQNDVTASPEYEPSLLNLPRPRHLSRVFLEQEIDQCFSREALGPCFFTNRR